MTFLSYDLIRCLLIFFFFFSFLTSDRLFARGATHRSTLQLGRFFYISFFPNMRVLCIDVGTLWLVIYKMSVNNKRYGTRKPPRKEKRIDVFCVGGPQKKISCWEFDIPPEPMALFFLISYHLWTTFLSPLYIFLWCKMKKAKIGKVNFSPVWM